MNVYRDSTEVTRDNIASLDLTRQERQTCQEYLDTMSTLPSVVIVYGGWCKTAEANLRTEYPASVLYFKSTTGRWGVASRHVRP